MTQVLPAAFAFRFAFSIPYLKSLQTSGARLLELPEDARIPWPGADLTNGSRVDFRAAWNAEGLGVSLVVSGKNRPPEPQTSHPTFSDGLQLWIDTRNTQTIHRANRFCHWFCILPAGAKSKTSAIVMQRPIARAIEDAPTHPPTAFKVASGLKPDGYWLDAWLPSTTLNGFDRETSPRLGFYALLKDGELRDVPLTVDAEFPFATDPSLWQTLNLDAP